jgi:cytochrome P450
MRSIVNRAFTPRAIAGMRPVVEAAVASLLDAATDGPIEVMSTLAEPLVVTVVLEHLGIPEDDRARVREWSTAIMRARSEAPQPAVLAPAQRARDELLLYLDEAPRAARTTVMDTLRDAAAGGETLTTDEMAMLLIHISLAGNGPSAYALGNAVLALASHPDQLDAVLADPELVPQAVEEALRFDSPTHIVTRVAVAETMLGPRRIRPGDQLHAVIGAANRDPEQFPDADRFDVRRAENRHLSFGMGMHFCLGAPLARLELEVAVRALIERYGAFRVTGMQRGGTFLLRGPQALVIGAAK